MRRRDRVELILEMLEALHREGGIGPTKLSLKVNLSYDRVKRVLDELAERGLVEVKPANDRRGAVVATLTLKGLELLLELRKVKSLLKDYGLL
ncbi:MAG: winged helix-turn-helix domain-containing protein [Candidatus Nezhaarchaeales archaeon]